jgi:hypothetical protein
MFSRRRSRLRTPGARVLFQSSARDGDQPCTPGAPFKGTGLNILLITLDQFRGDCLSCAGHPVVKTPNLDRLAAQGVRLRRHYSQCAPCGPGRASLYTGMYQMNHRVVANGTPLDATTSPWPRAAPATRRRCSATPTKASIRA